MKTFFWIDLEMTGLEVATDSILEIAVLVTDLDFNDLDELDRVIYQPQNVVDGMNDWCKKMHGLSGLTALIPKGKPLAEVELELLALADKYYPKKEDKIVLCGNSVYNDKAFIEKYLPEFSKRLHYRLIDVSSFKEIFKNKYGVKVDKANKHRAIDDIRECIAELKTYLQFINVPNKS